MPNFHLGAIFKKKEPAKSRQIRGSSSNQSMRPSYNEDLEEFGVIELGRESDVCSSVTHVTIFYEWQVYSMNLLISLLMQI